MSYNLILSARFQKEAKRLVKKYPSLKSELAELRNSLLESPSQGTPIGRSCYKIRISIASKNSGKSGGARIITNVYIAGKTVYLLTIYDKSELDNITDSELTKILKDFPN